MTAPALPVMDAATAAKLRVPFAATEVGKLPRVWCKSCRDSGPGKVCNEHRKIKCDVCKNNITSAHLHLDYVGHAEITDRLLQVDPTWTWEPVAMTPEGLPLLDKEGGLWIRLTVAGVTRMGYGDAEGKRGPSAIKEAIGDALRNAAMRFGVGLDLWGAKFDGDASTGSDNDQAAPAAAAAPRQETPPARRTDGKARTGSAAAGAPKPVRFEELSAAIATAPSEEALRALWLQIAPAVKDDQISEAQGKALGSAVKARKVLVGLLTEKNRSHLHVLWGQAEYGDDRTQRLEYTAEVVGRAVDSWSNLTGAEYRTLAAKLQAFIGQSQDAPAGAGVPA